MLFESAIKLFSTEIFNHAFQDQTLVSLRQHFSASQDQQIFKEYCDKLEKILHVYTGDFEKRTQYYRKESPINGDAIMLFLLSIFYKMKSKKNAIMILSIIKSFGQSCQLLVALKSMLNLLNSSIVTSFQMWHAVMKMINTVIMAKSDGPTTVFQFEDVPLFHSISRGINSQGYSWTAWICIDFIQERKKPLFSFLAESGSGVQTYVSGQTIGVRCLPYSCHIIEFERCRLEQGKWNFLSLVHDPSPSTRRLSSPRSKKSIMRLYINGQFISSLQINYPSCDEGNLQGTFGGYHGKMGSFHLFSRCLTPTHVLALYSLGPNAYSNPTFHSLNSGPVAVFSVSPSGPYIAPSNSPPNEKPPQSLPRVVANHIFSMSPNNSTNGVSIPSGLLGDMGSCSDHARHGSKVTIRYIHNNLYGFFKIGGYMLLYHEFSPAYRAPAFRTDKEIHSLFLLMANLLRKCASNQKQFFDMGVISVQKMIMDYIPTHLRTELMLDGIIELFLAVATVDISYHRSHVTQFFSSLLVDFTYWRYASASTQSRLLTFVQSFLNQENSIRFAVNRLTGIQRFLDNFRIINFRLLGESFNGLKRSSQGRISTIQKRFEFPAKTPSFRKRKTNTRPSSEHLRISQQLLHCMLMMAAHTELSYSSAAEDITAFFLLIDDCRSNSKAVTLLVLLLNTLLQFQSRFPFKMHEYLQDQFAQHLLLSLLNSSSTKVRLVALKIIGVCTNRLRAQRRKSQQLGMIKEYIKYLAELSSAIKLQLSNHDITPEIFDCLFEMLVGVSVTLPRPVPSPVPDVKETFFQNNNRELVLDETMMFNDHRFLLLIFDLLVPVISSDIVEKFLMSILTLLRTNPKNWDFFKLIFWQASLAALLSSSHGKVFNDSVKNEIIVQLYTNLLCDKFSNEPKGWLTLDEVFWSLKYQHQQGSLNVHDFFEAQVNLMVRLFSSIQMVQRQHNIGEKAITLQRNLFPSFQMAEYLLFFSNTLFKYEENFVVPSKTTTTTTTTTATTTTITMSSVKRISTNNDNVQGLKTTSTSTSPTTKNQQRNQHDHLERDHLPIELISSSTLDLMSKLLNATTYLFPLPEKRQDILRILFHYLQKVAPHSAFNVLRPIICQCVRHLFKNRFSRNNARNFAPLVTVLWLCQKTTIQCLERNEHEHVELMQSLIGELFSHWAQNLNIGDSEQNPKPSKKGKIARSPSFDYLSKRKSSFDTQKEFEWDKRAERKVPRKNLKPEDKRYFLEMYQEALDHIQKDASVQKVNYIFGILEHHKKRFYGLLRSRLEKLDEMMNSYHSRTKETRAILERNFLVSSDKLDEIMYKKKVRNLEVIHQLYGKNDNDEFIVRMSNKEEKWLRKIEKQMKTYHYEHTNSRPHNNDPSTLRNRKMPEFPTNEFWKLDTTESPTRMRRLLKKNFHGSAHSEASNTNSSSNIKITKPRRLSLDYSKLKKIEPMVGEQILAENTADSEQSESLHLSLLYTEGEGVETDEQTEEANEGDEGEYEEEDDDPGVKKHFNFERPQSPNFRGSHQRRSHMLVRCEDTFMITPTRKYKGLFTISSNQIQYDGIEDVEIPHDTFGQVGLEELSGNEKKKEEKKNLKEKHLRWSPKQVRLVLPRTSLLRETAIEIFLIHCQNYFFNFSPVYEEEIRKQTAEGLRNEVYKVLCKLTNLPFELSLTRRLQYSGLTRRWRRWKISNFEYLMHLNTISGRSYNDIAQYPVFPWIIADYTSEVLDFEDPKTFRDLSKPIGFLNEKRWQVFKARYDEMINDSEHAGGIPPFHYGSHYSSAGITLYYLLRLEPFTELAIKLQAGRFDIADRLFHSIKLAWELSLKNIGDVKELIPEFFDSPNFLRNVNKLDLGIRKGDNKRVNDVILPPWAKTPEDFVRINREALESDYVSAHLHEWIDLVFGYKNRGKNAREANNLFFYLTYGVPIDFDQIKDPGERRATEDQIAEFGQTPAQLMVSPHPKRLLRKDCLQNIQNIILPCNISSNYTGQLIHSYDQSNGQNIEIPTIICFTKHNILITMTSTLKVQTHFMDYFLNRAMKRKHTSLGSTELRKKDSQESSEIRKKDSLESIENVSLQSVNPPLDISPASITESHGEKINTKGSVKQGYHKTEFIENTKVNNDKYDKYDINVDFENVFSEEEEIPLYEDIPSSIVSSSPFRTVCPHWLEARNRPKGVGVITRNAKLIFSGGFIDNSVRCYLLSHKKIQDEHTPKGSSSEVSTSTRKYSFEDHVSSPFHQSTAIPISINVTCKELSSVVRHKAPITAICLAQKQTTLLTGSADGEVMLWRVFTSRHERTRPPLASSPYVVFMVHSGKVIDLAVNMHIGVAISLACDVQNSIGCESCLYSTRRGHFLRRLVFADPLLPSVPRQSQGPLFDMKLATITGSKNMVFYGTENGVSRLFLYSLNQFFLTKVDTGEVINVLTTTPYSSDSPRPNHGYIITGGADFNIVFRNTFNLEIVQIFYCHGGSPPHSVPYHTTHRPNENGIPRQKQNQFNKYISQSENRQNKHELLSSKMTGVVAIDISPDLQNMSAVIYPHNFQKLDEEVRLGTNLLQQERSIVLEYLSLLSNARVAIFRLPFSDNPWSLLGYDTYHRTIDDYGPRKSVLGKIEESKEIAILKLGQTSEKVHQVAKSSLNSMMGMLWKPKEKGKLKNSQGNIQAGRPA